MSRIASGIKRGSAELAVLSTLAEGPLHGYEIARQIEERSGGALRFHLASLYPTLYRLESRGWIKGDWREATSGRRRRYYRVTAAGKKQLSQQRSEWKLFFQALNRLAGVASA